MLTIDGGMDRLPRAFAARLGDAVRYGAEVRAIRRDGDGVRIAYCQGDEARELRADSCVAALPPVLLRNIPSDFGPAVVTALAGLKAAAAGKIGLQFARRFWEEDDGIYGGISYSSQPISQIVYPSDGFQGRSGVVVGYYHSGTAKDTLDIHPFKERERLALEQGAKLHPQYREEFCSSFSVAWQRVPRSEMPWVEWTTEADFDVAAKSLGAGDPPFFFAGDYLSYMSGWMQGALASAHKVVGDVHRRALRMSAEGRRPASRRFWAA
jgi:monoamine oxidase